MDLWLYVWDGVLKWMPAIEAETKCILEAKRLERKGKERKGVTHYVIYIRKKKTKKKKIE